MFRTVSRHVPPPRGSRRRRAWGTHDGLRALLGDGTTELRAERRVYVQRYASAEHWLEVYRNWFGPIRTAFEALDRVRQEELANDLVALLRRHDRSGGESLVTPMDYLEVVAVRR